MRMTITISKEMDAFLKRESERKGLSVSALLRLWVMERLNQVEGSKNDYQE